MRVVYRAIEDSKGYPDNKVKKKKELDGRKRGAEDADNGGSGAFFKKKSCKIDSAGMFVHSKEHSSGGGVAISELVASCEVTKLMPCQLFIFFWPLSVIRNTITVAFYADFCI